MKIVPNRLIIWLVVFFLQQSTVFAAPAPPPPSTPPPPPGLPLDGGIYIFMILSIGFGIYQLKKLKKASN
jgi:hypothetical protein